MSERNPGITKAVIVAGGRGTRFLPATLAIPKEILPILDRPMLFYALEEAVNSGLTDIVLVSAPGKAVMESYVTLRGAELARALGEHPGAPEIQRLMDSLTVTIVHQNEPLGLGHAILQASDAVGDEPFAVILPDDIVDAETPVLAQMLVAYLEQPGIHVGVEHVPPEAISAYGVVAVEPAEDSGDQDVRLYRVTGMVEKPAPVDAPSDLGIVGRYIFPGAIFDAIRRTPPGAKNEIQITDAMEMLRQEGTPAYAFAFDGARYDAGNPLGHLRAAASFALRRPDTAEQARAILEAALAASK